MGAIPPAHLTPDHQVIVPTPPFVNSRINDAVVPVAGVLETVKVVLVETVFVKKLPVFRLISLAGKVALVV